MAYRYFPDVMDGVRRLMRIHPDTVRKTEYRRKAFYLWAVGAPSVGRPDRLAHGPPRRVLASYFHPANGSENPQVSAGGGTARTRETIKRRWSGCDLPPDKLK